MERLMYIQQQRLNEQMIMMYAGSIYTFPSFPRSLRGRYKWCAYCISTLVILVQFQRPYKHVKIVVMTYTAG